MAHTISLILSQINILINITSRGLLWESVALIVKHVRVIYLRTDIIYIRALRQIGTFGLYT